MNTQAATNEDVKKAVDELIATATSYDIETLDRIYHEDLKVLMIDASGELTKADKQTFKTIFQSKRDAGDAPMSTWAEYHDIEVSGDTAHVLLSRKNNLTGEDMFLVLSIDLVHEDGRWQVTREVIYIRPDEA